MGAMQANLSIAFLFLNGNFYVIHSYKGHSFVARNLNFKLDVCG